MGNGEGIFGDYNDAVVTCMEAVSTKQELRQYSVLTQIVKPHKHVESLMDMFQTRVRIPSGPLVF